MDRQAKRMFEEGSTKGQLDQHELEIDSELFIQRTDYNETQYQWRGVAEIVETESHVFIYISAQMAYVIPKQGIIEGEVHSFVDQAVLFMEASRDSTE